MIDEIIAKYAEKGVCLYSITEIRDGIVDSRFITPSSRCHNCYSVAKVFTVTALGMLYDEGKLSTDEKVYDILRDSFPGKHDPHWEKITLHHLMLHRIGLEKGYLDIDVENIGEYGTDDFLRYAFSRSLPNEPDVERVYSDAAYYILSRVVAKKAGCDMLAYMRPALFGKLGYQEAAWSVCPKGYSMGATGLYISSEDTAKLGAVYLNGGTYNGKRVISKEWTDIVLSRGYELKPKSEARQGYGKGGMYGQMLYLSKKENCALAWHAYDKTHACQAIMDELNM